MLIHFFLLLLLPPLYGEEIESNKPGSVRIGFFAAPEFKLFSCEDNLGLALGWHGGIIINGDFSFGYAGYGVVSNMALSNDSDEANEFSFEYNGFILEYILHTYKSVDFTFNTLIGWGEVSFCKIRDNSDMGHIMYSEKPFFIFEPGVNIDFALFNNVHVCIGASYRLMDDLNVPIVFSPVNPSGFSANIMTKFGVFDGIDFSGK